MKYLVLYHFDVWGNEQDGFEVNDSVSREFDTSGGEALIDLICVEFEFSKLEYLRRTEMIDHGGFTEVNVRATGKPVLTIHEIEG